MKLNLFEKLIVLIVTFFVAISLSSTLISEKSNWLVALGVLILIGYVVVVERLFRSIMLSVAPETSGEPPKRMPTVPPVRAKLTTQLVLNEVREERTRQDAKWGEQNHTDYTATPSRMYDHTAGMTQGEVYKRITDAKAKAGILSFFDILTEEVYEAHDEALKSNADELRTELIQVAAVAVSWIEAIDRRHKPSSESEFHWS